MKNKVNLIFLIIALAINLIPAAANADGGSGEGGTAIVSTADNGAGTPTPQATPAPAATAAVSDENMALLGATPAPVGVPPGMSLTNLYNESFSSPALALQNAIKNKQNGWDYTGSDYQIDVGNFNSGSGNSLRFSSTKWYKDNEISLNFKNAGASGASNKLYLSFKFKFDTSTGSNYDMDSKSYFYIKDEDGTPFAAILLKGFDIGLVALDSTKTYNKFYTIYSGRSNVLGVWYKVDMFIDIADSSYSMSVNGVPINTDNGSWIPASSRAELSSALQKTLTGLGGIAMGNTYSSWWGNVNIDEISLSNYSINDTANFGLTSVSIVNKAVAGAPIINGVDVDYSVTVPENGSKLGSTRASWSFSNDSGATWQPMTTSTVPDGANMVKVDVTAISIYGQKATGSQVANVFRSVRPAVQNLAITGIMAKDSVLTAQYDFTSAVPGDYSKYQWYKTANMKEPFAKITGATNKTYTLTDEDLNSYIKVEVTPCDIYGLLGEKKACVLAPSDMAAVEAAALYLNIDTKPSGSSINLPQDDSGNEFSFGVDYNWKSDNTSVIEDNGTIHRPDYGTVYVNLTASIVKRSAPDIKQEIVFKVAVVGSKGDTIPTPPPPRGSGGGRSGGGRSGGGSSGGTVNVAVPASPQAAATPSPSGANFVDVPSDFWAYEYIEQLASKGVIYKNESKFRPNDPVTRAEFTKMIVEAFNLKDTSATADYSDVPTGHWAYVYVASAANKGIINGLGDGSFGQGSNISRQDMAVIIYRAAKACGIDIKDGDAQFEDSDKIAPYALTSVGSLQRQGILSGSGGIFNPTGIATRAEAAKVITMILNLAQK